MSLNNGFKKSNSNARPGIKNLIMGANLIQRFYNTTLSNDKTKFLLGKCLKKAFDESISDAEESENILALAWKFQVPQFDEMFQDHQNHDYTSF